MELPSGTLVHSNPWFNVRNRGGYFTIEYPHPQVIILPIVDDRAMVMVKARRPVLGDMTWELPAGTAFPDEEVSLAARRELREETGIYIPDLARLVPCISLSNSPNRNPQRVNVFRVYLQTCEFEMRSDHDGEVVAVECFGFRDIYRMIVQGTIYVCGPMAVIVQYFAEKHMKES